jgi:hypothetical protein
MVDILAPISVGELIDKITILRIKRERIHAALVQANVAHELGRLLEIRARAFLDTPDLAELEEELGTWKTSCARWSEVATTESGSSNSHARSTDSTTGAPWSSDESTR